MGSLNVGSEPVVRVLLADDHKVFAQALGQLLGAEPDLVVVGQVTTAEEATEFLAGEEVDVLVVDADLGDDSGIELMARIRAEKPEVAAVVLSCHNEVDIALHALHDGALAYVTKDVSFDDLMSAIRAAARGESWMCPRVLTPVLQALLHPDEARSEAGVRLALLSAREWEVLELLVCGLTQATIGKRLFLSPNTVRTHIRNILAKLEARSSLEAVAIALKAGIRPRDPAAPSSGTPAQARGARPGPSSAKCGGRRSGDWSHVAPPAGVVSSRP